MDFFETQCRYETIIKTYIFKRFTKEMKKVPGETQTLCADSSKAEPQFFAMPQTRSRGRRMAQI